ncbi:MAG: hypothetical protein AseanaTS_01180 [Candidatus Pelagadaptatus aseana]|uniref:ABC transporter substrate-binding protein n=1 Tax=Candidatus Pelagadaptatus aseana TaxID=3120508 RepID=UPI0039B26C66
MNSSLLWKRPLRVLLVCTFLFLSCQASARERILALYVPLADHYAALVAYERYRHQFKHADFQLSQMKNWDLLRAHFRSGNVDMAYVMSPLALDMYREDKNFRWVGLMHRDGNGLAVTPGMADAMGLVNQRADRKPSPAVAQSLQKMALERDQILRVGVPHILSTHTVVLSHFLWRNGMQLSLAPNMPGDVLAIPVAPAKAPAFILGAQNSDRIAAIEQSLPWVDQVENQSNGKVVWYSKDVLAWPGGARRVYCHCNRHGFGAEAGSCA